MVWSAGRLRLSVFGWLCLLVYLLAPPAADAGSFRVQGHISDEQGEPIEGVKVTITSPLQDNYRSDLVTDRKGKFRLLVLDKLFQLNVQMEKDGFEPRKETVRASEADLKLRFVLRRPQGDPMFQGPGGQEVEVAFKQGVAQTRSDDWEGARASFQQVVDRMPQLYQGWFNLATAQYNLKLYPESIESAEKALSIHPDLAQAHKLIADAHTVLGHAKEAEAHRDQVAAVDPKAAAELAFNRGADLANQGQDAEARRFFEEALATDPDLGDAHYELGLCLFRLGEKQAAREHLVKFVDLQPASPRVPIAKTLLAELDK